MYNIIFIIIMVMMLIWMQRSQKKQQQARLDQLNRIKKGDEIITIGGMYAIVDEINEADNTVVLDVDGVYLTFERAAIKTVVAKTEFNDGLTTEVAKVDESAVIVEAIESKDGENSAIVE